MKKQVLGLLVSVFSLGGLAWAAQQVRGDYNGIGFTVNFEPGQTASVIWDDNAAGFTGYYNPNPNPAPRCPCEVYEAGQRRVTIERVIGGGYSRAYYQKFGNE